MNWENPNTNKGQKSQTDQCCVDERGNKRTILVVSAAVEKPTWSRNRNKFERNLIMQMGDELIF